MKTGGASVSKMDLSNFLSDFMKEIINNVATHFNTMQARRRHEEANAMLAEFFSHYQEKKRNCKCKMVANMETQL